MNLVSDYVDWLTQNSWFILIVFVIGVASFFLNIFLYFRNKKEKRPRYYALSVDVLPKLGPFFNGLEMLYYGKKIERLTITFVQFWNDGKETIRHEDIAQGAPLRFIIQGEGEILDAKIIFTSNFANKFRVDISEKRSEAILDFDYIDKNEEAVIELLHTGKSSDFEIDGKIIGTGTPVGREYDLSRSVFSFLLQSDERKRAKSGVLKYISR